MASRGNEASWYYQRSYTLDVYVNVCVCIGVKFCIGSIVTEMQFLRVCVTIRTMLILMLTFVQTQTLLVNSLASIYFSFEKFLPATMAVLYLWPAQLSLQVVVIDCRYPGRRPVGGPTCMSAGTVQSGRGVHPDDDGTELHLRRNPWVRGPGAVSRRSDRLQYILQWPVQGIPA